MKWMLIISATILLFASFLLIEPVHAPEQTIELVVIEQTATDLPAPGYPSYYIEAHLSQEPEPEIEQSSIEQIKQFALSHFIEVLGY